MYETGRIRNPKLMASAGDVRVVCVFRLSLPRTHRQICFPVAGSYWNNCVSPQDSGMPHGNVWDLHESLHLFRTRIRSLIRSGSIGKRDAKCTAAQTCALDMLQLTTTTKTTTKTTTTTSRTTISMVGRMIKLSSLDGDDSVGDGDGDVSALPWCFRPLNGCVVF